MTVQAINLYTNELCPYAHRVRIALLEAGATFTEHEIDLRHKPEWYNTLVNPASKVPAVAYGGSPTTDSDGKPAPDSIRITESLVLLEFVADLFPDSGLLPKDPVERAKVRSFMNVFAERYAPFATLYVRPTSEDPNPAVLAGLEVLQAKLGDGPFLMGKQWTIAESAVAPFFVRMFRAGDTELGFLGQQKGKELFKSLEDPKYAKINAYMKAVSERESVQKTFPPELFNTVIGGIISGAYAK